MTMAGTIAIGIPIALAIIVTGLMVLLLAFGLLTLCLTQKTGVMLCVLKKILLSHPVIGELGITGKRKVFFDDLLGRAAHLALGSRRIKDTVNDIAQRTLSVRLVTRTGFG